MARESNVLVLDEPTNDLDIETLDLLQELLDDYGGTVLLVSHDRDFLDRVATTTIAMEGDGRATVYAGGWSDYRAQSGAGTGTETDTESGKKGAKSNPAKAKPKQEDPPDRLSFTEAHRLEELPGQIARLEAEIAKLAALLADAELYAREPVKFRRATEALSARQAALAQAEEEWLRLAEKAEAAG
jgi:ATP-binding cassette subfamily F protein uup